MNNNLIKKYKICYCCDRIDKIAFIKQFLAWQFIFIEPITFIFTVIIWIKLNKTKIIDWKQYIWKCFSTIILIKSIISLLLFVVVIVLFSDILLGLLFLWFSNVGYDFYSIVHDEEDYDLLDVQNGNSNINVYEIDDVPCC